MPQVVHAGTFSQKIDKQTLHTNPNAVGRLWQKHEARKSTPVARGNLRNSLEEASTVNAVCSNRKHNRYCY